MNPPSKTFSLISNAKLKQLYATMLRCRILDQRLRQLHKQEKWPGKYASSSGREAAAVGSAIDLRHSDWIAPAQQDVIASFIKGAPLATILARLLSGKGSLFTDPSGNPPNAGAAVPGKEAALLNILPPAPTLVTQFSIAAGAALASHAKPSGNVVMAFWLAAPSVSGPHEDSSHSWQDVLRYAAIHCLPLVLVAHGELPASIIPVRRKPRAANAGVTIQVCGVPVIPVDGNDVVAVYRVAHESLHKARHGGGPTLIKAIAWNQATDIGKAPVVNSDPIFRMETYLTSKGLFSATWKEALIDKFSRDMDAAMRIQSKPGRTRV